MTRITIELGETAPPEAVLRLLQALACLGTDEEVEVIASHDPVSLLSAMDEHDCECERARDAGGRYSLRIRRRT